jgi:Flp pilus assembly protein protease CpaA
MKMIYESLYIYILIAVTGALTIYTDVKEGKIKNAHLAAILAATIALYCVFIATGALKLSLTIITNALAGLVLGFILYTLHTWKAGDAKLFFLYSLLLTQNKNSYVLLLPCFTLFANIFLMSFIALIPLSLKDLVYHKKIRLKNIFSKNILISFIKIWLITFSVSFFIGPLLAAYIAHDNIIISLAFIAFSYLIYRVLAKINYIILFVSILITGTALKLFFMLEMPSISQMADFIKYTAGYSAIIILLTQAITLEKEKHTRIPFAPFMLMGALLSTTPFLEWAIEMLRYLR